MGKYIEKSLSKSSQIQTCNRNLLSENARGKNIEICIYNFFLNITYKNVIIFQLKKSDDKNDIEMVSTLKYYLTLLKMHFKIHYKIDIIYGKNEIYANESQEAIINNVKNALKNYQVDNVNWSLILSDPTKHKKLLQSLILRLYEDLQKVNK